MYVSYFLISFFKAFAIEIKLVNLATEGMFIDGDDFVDVFISALNSVVCNNNNCFLRIPLKMRLWLLRNRLKTAPLHPRRLA